MLGLLGLNAGLQAVGGLTGLMRDPDVLTAWQCAVSATAITATVGAWKMRRWSVTATLALAVVQGTMLLRLPAILALGPEAVPGIRAGAAALAALLLLIAWLLHRATAAR